MLTGNEVDWLRQRIDEVCWWGDGKRPAGDGRPSLSINRAGAFVDKAVAALKGQYEEQYRKHLAQHGIGKPPGVLSLTKEEAKKLGARYDLATDRFVLPNGEIFKVEGDLETHSEQYARRQREKDKAFREDYQQAYGKQPGERPAQANPGEMSVEEFNNWRGADPSRANRVPYVRQQYPAMRYRGSGQTSELMTVTTPMEDIQAVGRGWSDKPAPGWEASIAIRSGRSRL